MRATRSLITAAVLMVTLPSFASAQGDKKPDITGKWTFTTQSDYGTSTPTVSFTQKGDSLTGRYSSATLGERDFIGTIKDGKLYFGFTAEAGGQEFQMAFAGTLGANDVMQGSIEAAGTAFGTFSAVRQKKPQL